MRIFIMPLVLLAASALVAGQSQSNFATPTTPSTTPNSTSTSTPTQPQAYDPLLDPPPLPHRNATLIGGSITYLDPVRNQITLRPFGDGHKMHIAFDTRTQIVEDGKTVNQSALQTGQRVYIDTILNGSTVFAKGVQIDSKGAGGSGRGQILDYDSSTGTLSLRDELSNQPASFKVSPNVAVKSGNETRTIADLVPGALVSLTFATQQNHPVVQQVDLLAKPGSSFTFYGKITYVDLSQKTVALDNQNDDKNYQIHLTSIPQSMLRNLHEGTIVQISAIFDGSQYVARNLSFPGNTSENQQ